MLKGYASPFIIDENNDTLTQTIPSYISRGHSTMHLKYTMEIIKNTKENIGQRDFSFVNPYYVGICDLGYLAAFLRSIYFF